MKKLFIVNTYYQCIMAIHMATTVFLEDEVSVVLTDETEGLKHVYENIIELQVFENVFMVDSKKRFDKERILFKKIDDILISVFKHHNLFENIVNINFNELIFYNPNMFTYILFCELVDFNENITVSRYEEGILSYGSEFKSRYSSLNNLLRKIIHKKRLEESVETFYCLFPNVYMGKLKSFKIPPIESTSYVRRVFPLLFKNIDFSEYNYKYIYFTSVYDFEGGKPINEFSVVQRVAELVGKENLLVKMHPRDNRKVYLQNEFHVAQSSVVPWEAIIFKEKFTNQVLLTTNSGSVLSTCLLTDDFPKTYFMHKLCDLTGNPNAQITLNQVNNIIENKTLKNRVFNVHVANEISDILQ